MILQNVKSNLGVLERFKGSQIRVSLSMSLSAFNVDLSSVRLLGGFEKHTGGHTIAHTEHTSPDTSIAVIINSFNRSQLTAYSKL